MSKLENQDFLRLGHSMLDIGRAERNGIPEAVYCEGKQWDVLSEIVQAYLNRQTSVLLTRITETQRELLVREFAQLTFCPSGRTAILGDPATESLLGSVAIVSGGSSDKAIVDEAALTGQFFGISISRFEDVGVAGLPRIYSVLDEIRLNDVVIVVAGMEAALPTVMAGLLAQPIVAVPSSAGYGMSLEGVTPLLGMLASCSPGLSVVNINNGYGAMVVALRILRLRALSK